MNTKIAATALGSLLLGATGTIITENVELTATKEELTTQLDAKHQILKDNVWKDVRLGEIPEWDISIVSAEETTSAYAELANEKDAKVIPNLFEGLTLVAEQEGVKCK